MGLHLAASTRFGTLSRGLHTPSSTQRQHASLRYWREYARYSKVWFSSFLYIRLCNIVSRPTLRLTGGRFYWRSGAAVCYASSIGFAPMPYHVDIYNSILVVDFVHNPIFSHSYTPKLAGALKFYATMRAWILCQSFNPREYSSREAPRQILQLSSC